MDDYEYDEEPEALAPRDHDAPAKVMDADGKTVLAEVWRDNNGDLNVGGTGILADSLRDGLRAARTVDDLLQGLSYYRVEPL